MRQKYPHLIDGAIAASAPVLAFEGLEPTFHPEHYWRVVTSNFASPDASCAAKIRASWPHLFAAAASQRGRRRLARLLRLCRPPPARRGGERVGMFLAMALDVLAMGNYPYPSSYLTGGPGAPLLPAWPARAACAKMAAAAEDGDGDELLAALGEAAGVYNNASGTQTCYELPEDESYAGIWDYQWCPARGLARRCPPLLPAAAGPAVSPPPPQRAPHPLSGSRNIEFRAPRPSGLRRVSVVEQPPRRVAQARLGAGARSSCRRRPTSPATASTTCSSPPPSRDPSSATPRSARGATVNVLRAARRRPCADPVLRAARRRRAADGAGGSRIKSSAPTVDVAAWFARCI